MMQSTKTPGGVLVLTLTAPRIDAASAVHFKDEFREGVANSEGRILMDLSSVTFMDSSGLGAMVAALKSVKGRKLELCSLMPAVEKVFRLTRMDKVFPLHSSVQDALSANKGVDAA